MERENIISHYLAAVERAARRGGVDTAPLLIKHAIRTELLQDPFLRMPVETFSAFCDDIWHQMDDELFGLSGQPCKPGSFAFLAAQCMQCQDLRQVLQKAVEFYQLFTAIELELVEQDDQVQLNLRVSHPELDPENIVTEFLLVTWHRFSSWLIGNQVVLSRAEFVYEPPEHLHEYKYLFPVQHSFCGEVSGLSFSSQYLSQPLTREARELPGFLCNYPFSVLIQPQTDDSFCSKVRMLVKQSGDFPETLPDFETVAEQMNLTASTLRRKLKAEGCTYQTIKDLIRRDMAIEHMQSDALSITDIAHRVGFTEPGAFIRAFKSWTGYTPGSYRSASMPLAS